MDKLVCFGKNYLDHAKELGDQVPEKPVIFLKPPSVLRTAKQGEELALAIPPNAGELHFECEVVLRLGTDGKTIDAVSLGLDMTLRDRQSAAKKNGHPWTSGKVFRDAATVGPWLPFAKVRSEPFRFLLNDVVRQEARVSDMRVSPEDCIAYASTFFPLLAGDILFTGTPAGVGPVAKGDRGELQWGELRYRAKWE